LRLKKYHYIIEKRKKVIVVNQDMHTYSGKKFNPLNIESKDICIEDIAHALSLLCRGGGHFPYFYSVGQHSINCANEAKARQLPTHIILGCLLHDASEAYISDIIRPVKVHLTNYIELENHIMQTIFQSFDLCINKQDWDMIKQIDDTMLEYELDMILSSKRKKAGKLYSQPCFKYLPFQEVETYFINLYQELYKKL